jgi:hypothetical protein
MSKFEGISDADLQAEILRRAEEKRKRFIYPESPIGWWYVTTEGDCEGKSTKQLGTFHGHICEIALGLAGAAYYKLHFQAVAEPTYLLDPKDSTTVSVQSIADIAGNTVSEIEAKRLAKFFGPEWKVESHNFFQTIKVSKV